MADDASTKRIRTMLENREQFYADADVRIDTTGKTVEAVADAVQNCLKGLL